MQTEKEKWVNEVLGSLEGSQRAKPSADLFAKIEKEIARPEGRVISMNQLRVAAAAAILLLALNVFLLNQYSRSQQGNSTEWVTEVDSNEQLISDFNPYE